MHEFDENNCVAVLVWASKRYGGRTVGHVALHLPGMPEEVNYISLWPKETEPFFWPQENDYDFHTLADDYHSEHDEEGRLRLPEAVITLYSLDPERIIERFEEIKPLDREGTLDDSSDDRLLDDQGRLIGWNLVGNNLLINRGQGHSCASLAYELLKAGGLYSLLSLTDSKPFSSVVTPDGLCQTIIKAKRIEVDKAERIRQQLEEEKQTEPDIFLGTNENQVYPDNYNATFVTRGGQQLSFRESSLEELELRYGRVETPASTNRSSCPSFFKKAGVIAAVATAGLLYYNPLSWLVSDEGNMTQGPGF